VVCGVLSVGKYVTMAADGTKFQEAKFASIPHVWIIYTLLAASFLLHSFTLTRDVQSLTEEQPKVQRSRRQAAGESDNPDMSRDDYSGANVEFIHPKLREEEMSREGQDEMVWLTSYSRIPVRVKKFNVDDLRSCYTSFSSLVGSDTRFLCCNERVLSAGKAWRKR